MFRELVLDSDAHRAHLHQMYPLSKDLTAYLLSLPERAVRSASALAGGLLRETGEVTLPEGVRQSRLYTKPGRNDPPFS